MVEIGDFWCFQSPCLFRTFRDEGRIIIYYVFPHLPFTEQDIDEQEYPFCVKFCFWACTRLHLCTVGRISIVAGNQGTRTVLCVVNIWQAKVCCRQHVCNVYDVCLGHEQLLCPVQVHKAISAEEKRKWRGHWQEIILAESWRPSQDGNTCAMYLLFNDCQHLAVWIRHLHGLGGPWVMLD